MKEYIVSKTCYVCKDSLDDTAFAFRNKNKGVRHNRCRVCQSAYMQIHYRANKDRYIENVRRNGIKQVVNNRRKLVEYLKEHPCVDCGERDVRCLEFDHVRPGKRFNVSKLVRDGHAWESVLREIDLCEVRCANCHRKRTHNQFGFWDWVVDDMLV